MMMIMIPLFCYDVDHFCDDEDDDSGSDDDSCDKNDDDGDDDNYDCEWYLFLWRNITQAWWQDHKDNDYKDDTNASIWIIMADESDYILKSPGYRQDAAFDTHRKVKC